MLVTLSGIVTLVSPLHPANAHRPMLVTLSGITMLVSPLQSTNASYPMLVTFTLSGNEVGMVTAPVGLGKMATDPFVLQRLALPSAVQYELFRIPDA